MVALAFDWLLFSILRTGKILHERVVSCANFNIWNKFIAVDERYRVMSVLEQLL